MTVFPCPSCGAKFDLAKFNPGTKLRCSRCKNIFDVPSAPKVARAAAPAKAAVPARAGVGVGAKARVPTRPGGPPKGGTTRRAGGGAGTKRLTEAPEKKSKLPLILGIAAAVLILGGGGAGWAIYKSQHKDDGSGVADVNGPAAALDAQHAAVDWKKPESIVAYLDACRQAKSLEKEQDGLIQWMSADPAKSDLFVQRSRQFIELRRQKAGDDVSALLEAARVADKLGCVEDRDRICTTAVDCGEALQKKGSTDPKLDEAIVQAHTLKEDFKDGDQWLSKDMKEFAQNLHKASAATEEFAKLPPHERAVKTKIKELEEGEFSKFKGEFEYVDTPPYLVCMVKSKTYSAKMKCEEFANDYMKPYFDTFFEKMGSRLGVTRERVNDAVQVIWMYDSREQYMKETHAPPYAGGHFSPGSKYIYVYWEQGQGDPAETIFHEGTHQLLEYLAGQNGADSGVMFWFTEGMATNFESFTHDATGKLVIGLFEGTVSKKYCPAAKGMVRRGARTPENKQGYVDFDTILTKGYGQAVQQADWLQVVGDWYAESWSIVYFMYNFQEGGKAKYRDKWDKYVKSVLDGTCSSDTFSQIFGEYGPIEKEWVEFTKTLDKD